MVGYPLKGTGNIFKFVQKQYVWFGTSILSMLFFIGSNIIIDLSSCILGLETLIDAFKERLNL